MHGYVRNILDWIACEGSPVIRTEAVYPTGVTLKCHTLIKKLPDSPL